MRLLRSVLPVVFGAGFGAASFTTFSLLVMRFKLPMTVFFSVSLSAPASFFLLAIRLSVPMTPVAFSFAVSFTLAFLTIVVLLESVVVALLRELRVDLGAGGGTAVTLRADGAAAAAAAVGVTFLVDVLRTTVAAGFGAVVLAVAALALETMFDNIPDAPVFTGEVCKDFTGETGRASCDFGGGPMVVGGREAAIDAVRSFVLAERGESTWLTATAFVRDTARGPSAALTRFFGFWTSSFSLSSISSLRRVSELESQHVCGMMHLSRLLEIGFLTTALGLTGDGAAMPGRIAVVDSRWLLNLSIVLPIIWVRIL